MPYHLTNKYKASDRLEPEEEVVYQALKDYTRVNDPQDFVPTQVLYSTYLGFYAKHQGFDLPDRLNKVQFGVAINRIFELDSDRKSQRRVNGKRVVGYLGMRGPDSIRVPAGPGNPRLNHADTDD